MLFDSFFNGDELENEKIANRLEGYHLRNYSLVMWLLMAGLCVFIIWAMIFRIDEVTSAPGEVIASSRVQVIQSVDGGVLFELKVREGDRVVKGQVLARLDQTRIGAAVGEIEARLYALKAKATRIRAEVTGADELIFSDLIQQHLNEQTKVELALFHQRRTGLAEELRTLDVAVKLAQEEVNLVKQLMVTGDVNRSEVIRVERALNETEAQRINRKNKFLEDARIDLTKVEDEIAQNEQILTQRSQQFSDSVFIAPLQGIVKNISITTVGGVLRAGDELMQIIPVNEELIVESKVRPSDIAQIHPGLKATIRFDPFDFTIYGGVEGKVVYVSADTLKENTPNGEEIYYRVHISTVMQPVTTTTGKVLDILPGMTAQVDIRTGDRSLMEFLLKPLKKTLSKSFGER